MKLFVVGVVVVLIVGVFAAPAVAATSSYSTYRGSALLWSRDTLTWTYNGSTISAGSNGQSCGYIFPNVITRHGVSLYKYSSSHWRYISAYTIGAGVNTPWGAFHAYAWDTLNTHHLYANGYHSDSFN